MTKTLAIAISLAIIAGAIWFLPEIVTSFSNNSKTPGFTAFDETISTKGNPTDPIAFLERSLVTVGAKLQPEKEPRTYQLPRGVNAMDIGRDLRKQAREVDLELYVTNSTNLDAILRLYLNETESVTYTLSPALTKLTTSPRASNKRLRPIISVTFTNLGEIWPSTISELKVPFTVGVVPFSPMALHIAENATVQAIEVLVQHMDTPFAQELAAIPHASGFVVGKLPQSAPELPLGTLVVLDSTGVPPTGYRSLNAMGPTSDIQDTFARLQHIATNRGVSALAIPWNHTDIKSVTKWMKNLESNGFRLVLASEATRPAALRGAPFISLD